MLKVRTPEKLKELIAKFEINEAYYKSGDFLETQVRVEFINPLLRLLGWDVDNEAGHAQEYKDVIHEQRGQGSTHIDYVFRAGGVKKFLIEAKRPSENIEQNAQHADQARQYAFREKIPLIVVTDFEELSIYLGYSADGGEPYIQQGVEQRRVFYCRYTDFPRYWPFLFSLLSKKAVMLGLQDHLLRRLNEVRIKIALSVFSVGEFNLLYSIAQTFGGEDYAVEQDVELDGSYPPAHSASLERVLDGTIRLAEVAADAGAAFYLAPLIP